MPRLWTLGGVSGAGIGFNWIEHGGYFGRWTPARVKLDGCWQQCTSWCSTLPAEQVVWCAAEKSETMVESGAAAMWRCAGTEGESGGSGGSGGGVEHTLCKPCTHCSHKHNRHTLCSVYTVHTSTHCVCYAHQAHRAVCKVWKVFDLPSYCRLIRWMHKSRHLVCISFNTVLHRADHKTISCIFELHENNTHLALCELGWISRRFLKKFLVNFLDFLVISFYKNPH